MLFNSTLFLIFFVVVTALYWILPHKFRWIMLLIASYYFYMSWNANLVVLIGGTTLISYLTAILIEKTENKKLKKAALLFNVIVSLGVLFFFKYFNFFAENVVNVLRLFGLPVGDVVLQILLPVGVSFYTFQTLSYTIDVYRGNFKAERHLGYYALFVSFFPQLVAGPIERPDNLLPQLREKRNFDADNFKLGIEYMLVGFFKKLVVADFLATFVNAVYNNPNNANGLSSTIATVLFAIQILCDFDGYTNIAIGVAKLLNINLMKNFNNPYSALSIKDFWSRWHISLSAWFKDYLYIPLGGNRVKKPRYYFNLFVTFLVSGLWHGANWTFILWGTLHGIYQIIGHLKKDLSQKITTKLKIDRNSNIYKLYCRAVTFALVCLAWIFFRANSVSDAFTIIAKIFTDWSFSLAYITESFNILAMNEVAFLIAIFAVLALYYLSRIFIDKSQNLFPVNADEKTSSFALKKSLNVMLIMVIVVAWIYILALNGGENSFIYFQF